MVRVKIAAAAVACLLTTGMAASVSAMPINGTLSAEAQTTQNVQQVRWVCGPYRCWWRPGPYWWPGRPWGWWGWHRWGWHPWGWHGWGWHRHW